MKMWSQYPPPPLTLSECAPECASASSTASVPEPVQSGWEIDQSAGFGGPPAAADSNPSQSGSDAQGRGPSGEPSGSLAASPCIDGASSGIGAATSPAPASSDGASPSSGARSPG